MTTPLLVPSTSTRPEWSAWARGLDDVRGVELPIDTGEVRLKFNDVSTFVVTLAFTPERWTSIGRGTRMEIRRNRELLFNGPIVERQLQVSAEHPGGIIQVAGESDEGHLADRICYPNPALDGLAQVSGAKYTQTAVAETLVKTLVDLNAGPGAIPARRHTGLTVEPTQGRGSSYTATLRYDNLLKTIQTIARDAGPLGFRIEYTPAGRIFRVYEAPDLSTTVRFTLGMGNLNGLTYRESAPTVTYGSGEGSLVERKDPVTNVVTRPKTPVRHAETTTDPASIAYTRRAETWLDAGESLEEFEDLVAAVHAPVVAGRAPVALPLDPSPDYVLGVDPATILGALVTVQVGPLDYTDTASVVDIVREVRFTYDLAAGKDTVIPAIGADALTGDGLGVTTQLGGLDRRLSLLERRR